MTGAPVAVDGASVPQARPDVAVVTLDGEAVIHRRGQVHVLDPVATLVWRCADGEASVNEIAADLADAFAASPESVLRDVGHAVERLTALDLLADAGADAGVDSDSDSAPRDDLLVDPPGSCPSCVERHWAFRRSYRTGTRVASVAANNERADAVVRAVFAAQLVDTPPELATEPPFFAVELHEHESGGLQRLDLLHRGDTIVARSRRPDRVVRALAGHLASYGDLGALGLAAVNGLVVGRGERAMVVAHPADPLRFRRALARHGVLVADMPVALVDPSTGDVVVGAPGLDVDLSPIEALALQSSGLEADPLPWGRARVVAIGVPAPASPAAALLALGPAEGDHGDHDGTLRALLALFDAVPVTDAADPEAISAELERG
ncbi:MAG: PqqD family protein [Acidimicrobiia bacterium]